MQLLARFCLKALVSLDGPERPPAASGRSGSWPEPSAAEVGVEATLGGAHEREMGDSVLLESGDGQIELGAAGGNGGVEATLGRALEQEAVLQEAQEALLLEFGDGPLEVDAAEGNGGVVTTLGGALEL